MQEVEAMDFVERVTEDDAKRDSTERVLEAQDGAALTVEIVEVERGYMLDQLQKLPEEMLSALAGAEDPEEAQDQVEEEDMLTAVNSDTIDAFENLCAAGIEHADLTSQHIEKMVSTFDLEVLFPIGAEIMEISFDNGGSVTDFHEPS